MNNCYLHDSIRNVSTQDCYRAVFVLSKRKTCVVIVEPEFAISLTLYSVKAVPMYRLPLEYSSVIFGLQLFLALGAEVCQCRVFDGMYAVCDDMYAYVGNT
jgi:hypothetical protein